MPVRRPIPKKTSQPTHSVRRVKAPPVPKAPTKRAVIRKYEKAQCSFVEKGIRCIKHAVGKSSLCQRHNPQAQHHQVQISSTKLPSTMCKYNPSEHILGFIRSSQQGKAPVEIAAEFQVAQGTLLSWAEEFQDFNDAVEIGKAAYESFWLQTGRENLNTKSFSTPLYKFLTGNTLGYSDKVETKSFSTNIHGVLCLPAQDKQTAEEWQAAASGSGKPKQDCDIDDIIDVPKDD